MKNRRNTLSVFYGSMFSGKSSALIEDCKKFKLAGFEVLAIKPQFDTRYEIDAIATHSGEKIPAVCCKDAKDILRHIELYDVIAIDEIQFFDPQILEIVQTLLNMGKTVLVAGLDMDFRGVPFGITSQLVCLAENPVKLRGVCQSCGDEGYISHKKVASEERLQLGGSDIYECLCRKCYQMKKE